MGLPKWEYRCYRAATAEQVIAMIQPDGVHGWELVSVAYDVNTQQYVAFLKRPLVETKWRKGE